MHDLYFLPPLDLLVCIGDDIDTVKLVLSILIPPAECRSSRNRQQTLGHTSISQKLGVITILYHGFFGSIYVHVYDTYCCLYLDICFYLGLLCAGSDNNKRLFCRTHFVEREKKKEKEGKERIETGKLSHHRPSSFDCTIKVRGDAAKFRSAILREKWLQDRLH